MTNNMHQQEESMDEILSSIRRILSDDLRLGNGKKGKTGGESAAAISKEEAVRETAAHKTSKNAPFILTPEMRVDRPTPISELVLKKIDLTELDVTDKELRPSVRAWLNANLPQIVEKVVREEVVRVLTRVK